MNERPADLSPKLQFRRKLSWFGLGTLPFLAMFALFLYTATQTCDELGCIAPEVGLVLIGLASAAITLLSVTGFVTTSKSYHDNQKRSVQGIVVGSLLVISSLLYMKMFIADNVIYQGPGTLMFFTPFFIIGLALLTVGLLTLLKAFRAQNRLIITGLLLLITILFLATYISIVRMYF